MVVIAFGQKIAERIVRHARLGAVNLHASRLPRYRGAAPVNWAIIRGETISGNSVIRLASRMDAGAILGQSTVPIGPAETAGELHDRLAEDGVSLMLRVLDDLASGRAVETPQDERLATAAPKLSREAARIDWTRPAGEIGCQIRGMSPWPGCRVRLLDAAGGEISRLTLLRAVANGCEGDRWTGGEIMMQGCVQCGAGTALNVLEVQPEGRRPMPLEDYRRGHAWSPGMRLESIV
jgi:methionyl-tRNA formyltransferase